MTYRAEPLQRHDRCIAANPRLPAVRAYPEDPAWTHFQESQRVAVGYNPERRAALTARHNIDPSPFTLLWMGVVDTDEAIGFLLDRARDVHKRSTAMQLVIIGGGPALEHYRSLTAELDYVHWLGDLSRADRRDWCNAADLLVLPDTVRDDGTTLLQAQAAGLPAIVTDIYEPRGIVRNGETGYTLSLADPKAWTLHILTLMHSKFANPAAWAGKRREIVQSLERRSDLVQALADALNLQAPQRMTAAGAAPRRDVA